MTTFRQEIRFARTADGVRIAFAVSGQGHPVVRTATWLSNIEFDWQTPVLGPQIEAMSERRRLYRYNPRGYGLSEGEGTELSLETHLHDLRAVIDEAGHRRVALYGTSGGGAIAIAFAARYPDCVTHLVLMGAFARGLLRSNPTIEQKEKFFATVKLIELGWGEDNPAFRQIFTSQLFPNATLEQIRSINELQRTAASGRQAARFVSANQNLDVSDDLPRVRCPTLVMHCRGDLRVPFEQGRMIAAAIPGARFVPLESENHVPLKGEPAFDRLIEEVDAFLPSESAPGANHPKLDQLTNREREVLDQIARGLDNGQIAAEFGLSAKTVRNHITNIFEKLAVGNRAQAIVMARDAGLGR